MTPQRNLSVESPIFQLSMKTLKNRAFWEKIIYIGISVEPTLVRNESILILGDIAE